MTITTVNDSSTRGAAELLSVLRCKDVATSKFRLFNERIDSIQDDELTDKNSSIVVMSHPGLSLPAGTINSIYTIPSRIKTKLNDWKNNVDEHDLLTKSYDKMSAVANRNQFWGFGERTYIPPKKKFGPQESDVRHLREMKEAEEETEMCKHCMYCSEFKSNKVKVGERSYLCKDCSKALNLCTKLVQAHISIIKNELKNTPKEHEICLSCYSVVNRQINKFHRLGPVVFCDDCIEKNDCKCSQC